MTLPMYSPAGSALGLNNDFGGGTLTQQVAGETEEQRRKRMQQMQQANLSPAGRALAYSSVGAQLGIGGI